MNGFLGYEKKIWERICISIYEVIQPSIRVVGVTRDKYFRSNRMDARSPSLTCHHRLIKNNSVSRAQESFSTSRGTAGTAGTWYGDLVGWSCLTAAVVVQMKREMGAEKHCTVRSRTPAPQPIKAAGKPRPLPQPEAGLSTWPASLADRVSPPQPPPQPEVGPSSRPATLADWMAKMRPPNSFHDTFGTGWATYSRDELAIAPCPAISKSWLRRGYGPLEEIRGLNMVLADLKVEYLAS